MNKSYTIVIKPKTSAIHFNFKELFRYRDLIFLFIKRNFITLYKQTILGPAWSIIRPLLTTVIYSVIFGNIAGLAASGVPTFIFYMSGTVIWMYFAGCLTSTANTFVTNRNILGKVYFPRLVMPISTVLSKLIDFAIQYVFFIGFLIYYLIVKAGVSPNIYMLMTPLLVIQLAMLGLGFGIIVSSMTTKYRDLSMLVVFGVELWKYLSPVAYDMYSMNAFAPGGKFHTLYMLNPITPITNIFRYAYLGIGEVNWDYYAIGWFTTIIVLMLGVLLFNRVEKTFMDTI